MPDNLLSKNTLNGNWTDLAFFIFIIYFILTNEGFISSLFDFLGFILSFIFSFKTYHFFSKFFVANFSLSQGLSYAFGFAVAWLLAEIIFFILVKLLLKKIPPTISKSKINFIFGSIPALFQGTLLFSFIITLIVALPVRGDLKAEILNSRTGPILINFSQKIEAKLRPVFDEAIIETLNFLTIKQNSEEKVDLQFKLSKDQLKNDAASEMAMFNLINQERQLRGIKLLVFSQSLTEVAREYGEEMFTKGFFSHYSEVDNSSPVQRLERKNIDFIIAGENLAFAPDVRIAHQGLMNSPGHRENILSPNYEKVGIGVIDGGIFGKIFVQEFTD